MAVLVERATSDLLIGPDWGMNLEICDAVNYNPSLVRDVVKAIKKRLSNKSAKVQLLALTVLEMAMKNCGDSVHQMVAEKDVLRDMAKIVKKKGDLGVRDKILSLLESWQKAFGGPTAKYSQFAAVYDELRRSGVQFPAQTGADTAPMYTPPAAATQTTEVVTTHATLAAAHTTRSVAQLSYGLPMSPPAPRLDEVLAASENFVWSAKDLDGARRGLEVLNEMLNALDPQDKQAVHDDLITQLVEQCVTNQKITRQLVNSTLDENLLCQGLALNDDIQQVLARHSAIVSRSSRPAELTLGSPRGLVVYDQEDDETEEELLRLVHRSSSKSSRSSLSSQENGLQSNTHYPPPQQPAPMASTPSMAGRKQPGSGGFSIEGASLAASSGQVTQSRSPQVSDEQLSMLNPFANMASIPVTTASHHSLTSATVNGTLDSSNIASYQPSHNQKILDQQNSSLNQKIMGQQNSSAGKVPHADDDNDMLNPWSLATEKSTVSSLPPPPILYTERQRFFEERRQMIQSPKAGSLTPSSMERRMGSLNLLDTPQEEGTLTRTSVLAHPASSKFQHKQVLSTEKQESSVDQLFDDLVDIRSVRANFKNAGVASNRSNAGGAGGM
eukprot:c16084_g1_i1 orf=303-2141(-)